MRKTHRLAMAAIGLLLAVVCSGQGVPTYTLSIVAKTGDTINGLTITQIAGGLSINNHRDVAFLVGYSGGGTALLTQNGVLVKTGDTISGHTMTQVGAGTPAINNNGLAAFNGSSDVRGLFTQNALVVLQNGTISGILLSAGFSGNLALNDSGTLAFSGGNNTQFGIFTQNGVVALIGDTIGGLTLTNVGLSPALNNTGTVAFNGFFSNGSGIFTGTGVLVKVGDTISGKRITNINSSPALNNPGVVAFNARDNSGGGGIFTQNSVVTHDGDTIGGLTVTVISGDNPAINDSGTVAFAAQFINSAGLSRLGFFTQNGVVAKGGDVVAGKTLAGFFGTNGSVVAINAQGDVAFVSRFSDGTQGVVLARYNNTPAGSGVTVQPIDTTTGTTPVTLTFNTVTADGATSLTTSNSGPPPPSGFQLGSPPTYYNLDTTASFAPPVQVCINYTGVSFTDESQLRLFHFEGGSWVDQTVSLDTINKIICASVSSLSPFAIFQRPVFVNTQAGSNVVVQPADSTTGATPATLTFSSVSQAGTTTLATSSSGPAPPAGFALGIPPVYYNLATTATFTGSISICINYTGITFTTPPSLFQFQGGAWVDMTASQDTTNHIVCGSVTSLLSPFGLFRRLDTTPPVIVPTISGTAGTNGWYTSNVMVSWSVTDPESGIASSPGCGSTNLTANTPGTTLTCSATNGAGLLNSVSVTIKIDQTAPVAAPTITGTAGANGWYTSSVTVSWSVTDPESGIASSTGCGSTNLTTNTLGTTLTCSATNGAGLMNSVSVPIKIDQTPPMVVPTITGTAGTNGWYASNVTVSWSVTDPESGIASSPGCDATTLTTNTTGTTLTCSATNGAGLSNLASVTIKIDQTPPLIVPTITGTAGTNGWYTSNVTVSWSVTDPESGIASSPGCGSTNLTANTPGTTLTCSATNGAGLVNSVSVLIKIDQTAPLVVPTIIGTAGSNGWFTSNVTVTWSVTDPESGIASSTGCASTTLTTNTPGTTLTCSATNGAGLLNSVPVTIKIDTSRPVITPSLTPAPNAAGWNNSNVTVAWGVTDPIAGIAGSAGCAPTTVSTETTGATFACSATNGAGLSSSASITVKLDKTAPAVSNVKATPNPVQIGHGTTLTATISDSGGSNTASAAYNINGGAFTAMTGTFGGATASVSATLPVFTAAGVYSVCVHGADVASNVGATSCVSVPVFDSNKSVAAVGGTNSPAGADPTNPTASGPVLFAFAAAYLFGSPTGDLAFHFTADHLDFIGNSTTIDYLVVTGEPRARIQGTGTLNKTTVCKYQIDAWDESFQPGNKDAFGLRIFSCTGGSGDRYNLPAAPITSGDILIH